MTGKQLKMLLEAVPLLEVLDAVKCQVMGSNRAGYDIIDSLPKLQILDLDSAVLVVPAYTAIPIANFAVKESKGRCFDDEGLMRLRSLGKLEGANSIILIIVLVQFQG
ncbi:hypothetical protein HDU76_000752 [Blyttiomyces sp. JEL0837]|nr:hypothetical protein HDU76_000752 [Blyttiomyces sp. JEL0837]